MKICGTSFIPIFVTILFSGVIFIYFNSRLAEVKSSVEKQNRVLTAFITNVQQDIKTGGNIMGAPIFPGDSARFQQATQGASRGANNLASEEALHVVKSINKIVVSDDEDDDSETDSDDESNTSSDSESDDDEDTVYVDKSPITIINLHDEVSNTTNANNDGTNNDGTNNECTNLEVISDNLVLDFEQVPQEDSSLEESSKIAAVQVESLLSEEPLKVVDVTASQEISSDLTKADAAVGYDQMKVDDLRKIVTDLNLAVKEDVKKLKKNELLVLLKNKKAE